MIRLFFNMNLIKLILLINLNPKYYTSAKVISFLILKFRLNFKS